MKILGYEFKVDTSKSFTEDRVGGDLSVPRQLMRIAGDLAPEQIESTMIHEIIEAINGIMQLELKEKQVCALEVGIWGALHDNGVDLSPLFKKK